MSNPLQQTIETLAKEKGIEPDVVITAIEDAVLTASRKFYKSTEDLRTKFNHDTGQVELYSVRQIVEEVTDPLTEISLTEAQELYGDEAEVDMEIEFPKPTDVLGRIAAQTAKQVIFQKVREAERDNVYDEYIEAILRRRDQSRAENYTTGDRIRAVIVDVTKETKGQQIILSRTEPALLVKMFEQEVPEIYDGTVSIRGAVREAGDRAKVAVHSHERDIDPVGSCVGMKGTRVQAIIRELRGEKIDIVEWSDDPIVFITNAVSPARIQRVTILDDTERVVEIVVEDSQLSLAIGKKGQNVRLAAKLTGWRIDIKSDDEKRAEVEAQFEGLEDGEEDATLTLPGLDDAQLVKLSEAGLDTADLLLETSVANLAQVAEVDEQTAIKLQDAVREQVAAAEQAAAEIAETTLEEESPVDSGDQSNDGIQEITVSEGDPAGKDSSIVESGEENTNSVVSDSNSTDPQESATETDSKSIDKP